MYRPLHNNIICMHVQVVFFLFFIRILKNVLLCSAGTNKSKQIITIRIVTLKPVSVKVTTWCNAGPAAPVTSQWSVVGRQPAISRLVDGSFGSRLAVVLQCTQDN